MQHANPFDLLASPLRGTHLIEASAGTGKTYTITCLYLRLVLEGDLSADKILAVTFTEAATLELKDRIRQRINEAIRAFSRGESDDGFLAGLVEKIKDAEGALDKLKSVLRDFDEAAVYTIHGFCRRVLYENAFESGSLFDTELIPDEQEVMREIVEDFWRKNFYEASLLFVSYVIEKRITPDSFISLASGNSIRPHMKIVPQDITVDTTNMEKDFRSCLERVRQAWKDSRDEVRGLLQSESLKKSAYNPGKIGAWLSAMDRFAYSGGNSVVLFPGFEKFTSGSLKKAVRKDKVIPEHSFFELCEDLLKARDDLTSLYERNLLGIKAALFPYVRKEMAERKAERNVQSFNDLLVNVQRALEGGGGERFARSIRERYSAVLIDEFQDTDPVQYSIFKRIFGNRSTPFFLIGDPKQSIYGFRGADVFTYMAAARNIRSRYTLLENWRSARGLVKAVNAVFTSSENPFIYDEINFYPGTAVKEKDAEALLIKGNPAPAFQLWFLDAQRFDGSDRPVNKGDAKRHIKRAVASEISRLIALGRSGEALLGKRPLREGDMAVLVRTNVEGRDMQKALSALQIPSVLYSTGSLFDSHEAVETRRLLTGICEIQNESLVRAALSTDIMGFKGESIKALMDDEPAWDELMGRIRAYGRQWNRQGFVRMFRGLLEKENVLPRLMSLPDGERRNTNVLHLSEVLHRVEIEQRLGMTGLVKWLSEKMESTDGRTEEYQLRLETDENAVQIVTIHKSKGLEYPVVFCPFAWEGSKIKDGPVIFHDEAQDMGLVLDLGSEKKASNLELAQKEELSENLRLLYVALTRAKSRCYMVWGRVRGSGSSAQAYLFHGKRLYQGGKSVSAQERFNEMDDDDVRADLTKLTERAEGEIMLSPLPVSQGRISQPEEIRAEKLSFRKVSRKLDDSWRISSFSSLTSATAWTIEQADRDALNPAEIDESKKEGEAGEKEDIKDIFTFPKGARAGTFFHDLLENLDFTGDTPPGLVELASLKLYDYGFEGSWLDTVCRAVTHLLRCPLSLHEKDFTLSKIDGNSRLNEMEFYFPLKRITPRGLRGVFEKSSIHSVPEDFPETMERLYFRPSEGFMRGFIDMVFEWKEKFYLVDWKSNFLGGNPEDYGRESIWKAMKSHWYVLQYHIYTLALDRYLKLRIPGYSYASDFGGVFYIFLRGIDPMMGPDYGIFRDVPSQELMEDLRASLIDMPDEN